MSDAGAHYFAERPDVASAPDEVELALPDVHLRLATDRGVFSHGRVDAGTKLLLLKVPAPPPAGDLLDLGCGVGPIALTMATPRAGGHGVGRRRQRTGAGAVRGERRRPTGSPTSASPRPTRCPTTCASPTIWSNPPIRIGKAALHDLLLRWLGRLAPDGDAHLVVHKHLGADSLQRWLAEQGHPTERTSSSAGYRILHVAAA